MLKRLQLGVDGLIIWSTAQLKERMIRLIGWIWTPSKA